MTSSLRLTWSKVRCKSAKNCKIQLRFLKAISILNHANGNVQFILGQLVDTTALRHFYCRCLTLRASFFFGSHTLCSASTVHNYTQCSMQVAYATITKANKQILYVLYRSVVLNLGSRDPLGVPNANLGGPKRKSGISTNFPQYK